LRITLDHDRDALLDVAARLSAGDACGEAGRAIGAAILAQLGGHRASEGRRNDALRRAAEMLLPGGPVEDQADLLRSAIRRYATRWMRADRHRDAAPASYVGTVDSALFDASQASGRALPASPKQLRRILLSR